jgi:hypothetical protein
MLDPQYIVGLVEGGDVFPSLSIDTAVVCLQCDYCLRERSILQRRGYRKASLCQHKDSLDALDAHVQWGVIEATNHDHRPSNHESRKRPKELYKLLRRVR